MLSLLEWLYDLAGNSNICCCLKYRTENCDGIKDHKCAVTAHFRDFLRSRQKNPVIESRRTNSKVW